MLAMGSRVWADDEGPTTKNSRVQPLMADSAAVTPAGPTTLLDAGLDKVGLYKPMNDLGINITGFVDVGYGYDTTVPANNGPRRFQTNGISPWGGYKGQVLLDQVALTISKNVDVAKLQKGNIDWGFTAEGVYGRDTFYFHSNGLLDNNTFGKGNDGPDNELDLEQANLSIGIPLGNGLIIEAGKFDTLIGYETIDAPKNPFYTHSDVATREPGTQTGILASYYVTADGSLIVTAGATRGFNQSTLDNNSSPDFLGEVTWKVDPKLTISLIESTGPQYAKDESNYTTLSDLVVRYQLSDQLQIGAEAAYVYLTHSPKAGFVHTADSFGFVGYAKYQFCKYAAFQARAEWTEDDHGYLVGTGSTFDYSEVTVGLSITPLPDTQYFSTLTIRPEIRCDWSDHKIFDGAKFSELNAAIDAYLTF